MMARKVEKRNQMKSTSPKSKPKNAKASKVVVNGKRSSAGTRKFNIQNILSSKVFMMAMVLVFGGVGVYFLVQSFAATPTADMSTFNITTWNSYYGNKTNVGKSIKTLGKNSDIIGIQEAHKPAQRKNIKKTLLCSKCKYRGYIQNYTYDGSSAASLPILWNKDKFTLQKKGNIKTSDRKSGIKDSTGKNAKVSPKYITWVRLKDKATGHSFYVFNTHTVASIEMGGEPNNNTERLKLYDKTMNALVKRINKLKGANNNSQPIIILGDFNVDYRKDAVHQTARLPYSKLGKVKVHSTYERLGNITTNSSAVTHGDRIIDYIFTLDHDRMTVDREYIDSAQYGSDHRPVSATLTLYKAALTTKPQVIPIGTSNLPTAEGVIGEQNAIRADEY